MHDQSSTPPSQQRRARVVVIDDDLFIRDLVSIHLRNAGHEVHAAADAVEGGHTILRIKPDLVLCDVEMPYLNGYDLVAALKTDKATADIPVVFLSVREDLPTQAARLGAAAYLRKPVRSDRLLEVVEMYAGS